MSKVAASSKQYKCQLYPFHCFSLILREEKTLIQNIQNSFYTFRFIWNCNVMRMHWRFTHKYEWKIRVSVQFVFVFFFWFWLSVTSQHIVLSNFSAFNDVCSLLSGYNANGVHCVRLFVCLFVCICVASRVLHIDRHNRSQFGFGLLFFFKVFYINCLESSGICGLKCA